MTPRLKLFLAAVSFSLILPLSGFATEKDQKDGEGNQQQSQEAKEDSLGIYDEENKINDPFMLDDQLLISQEPITPERSTPPSVRSETKKVETEEDEDSNSAMSFNFIYYIIDKFKLADPMD